jgi:membrane protein implicated in regulation of membrane protease activity
MIIAFIAGLLVAGLGALLSVAADNWQVSFVISGTVAVISVVLTSLFRNVSVISEKRSEIRKEGKLKAIDDIDVWAKIIAIIGFPNVIVAVWLFLKLYM